MCPQKDFMFRGGESGERERVSLWLFLLWSLSEEFEVVE
jgi:hypothetical protein